MIIEGLGVSIPFMLRFTGIRINYFEISPATVNREV